MQTYGDMKRYAEGFADFSHGEYDDWLIAPCVLTRDSDCLEQSNWYVQLRSLGGESETVQVHRFSHWACGWLDRLLINPADSAAIAEAEQIKRDLADYPALDETDWSEREHADYERCWQDFGQHEFANALQQRLGLSDLARDAIADADPWRCIELFESLIPSGDYQIDGCPRTDMAARDASRGDVAAFIRAERRASKETQS